MIPTNDMKHNKLITGYEITTDTDFLDFQNAITPELKKLIPKYHEMALAGKKGSIPKFLEAIEKHPKNPHLKNYLSVLYTNIGNIQKAYETNHWMVSEHPNYLFGKLNLAHEYFQKKEYQKIPEILGNDMEIKALYPHRDKFHIKEVTAFFKIAIFYYAAIGNLEQAEIRFEILEKIDPDSDDTNTALRHLMVARLEAGAERMKEEEKLKIKVKGKKQKPTGKTEAPEFVHNEIEVLYQKGLHLEKETINTLLLLPRETLITDLENVLNDSIVRFAYFHELSEQGQWNEETMNFAVHAIYLLGELEATESIDTLFNVLSQSDEYFDIYFGDFLTSALWEPFYKIAHNQLNKCYHFMCLPAIDTYAKELVNEMVAQIALHRPERKTEVIEWFKKVNNYFLNCSIKDNVIDSDLIALTICDIIDIEANELLPQIKKLFDKGMVSVGICGVYASVEKAFAKPSKYSKKKKILSIADRYNVITTTWAGYTEGDIKNRDYNNDYLPPQVLPVRAEPKVGRNDPCPCGSVKKYKKCCLEKE